MSNPLIVAVISSDRNIREAVASALDGNAEIETFWTIEEYPDSASLAQIRKAEGGCVIFLDFANPIRAKAVAAEIDRSYPMAGTVAIHAARQPQDLMELMQLGVREVLALPVSGSEVMTAFSRVARKLRSASNAEEQGGQVYAFLPAKPGAGATTLAAHSAAASARLTNQRTLLLDLDFRLGLTSFLFKLNGTHSVLDAIASPILDADLFQQMVCRRGMLDILGSAPVQFGGPNPETGAANLVELARQSYSTVCIDLPGEMREYELAIMHQAKECFLVTTPDIGALHMAKKKAELLHGEGLQSKVSVIVNRVENRGVLAVQDLEAILQLPIRFSVPAAEKQIAESIHDGCALEGSSPLVTQIEAIARRMGGGAADGRNSKPRKFIEMFSISQVRDRKRWGW